jgi:hypothetical protein
MFKKKPETLLLEIKSLHAKLTELQEEYIDAAMADSPGVPRGSVAGCVLPKGCLCESARALLERGK